MPSGMSYEPRRGANNAALSRAYQIQEEALRKENAVIYQFFPLMFSKKK